jgi:hypothetical protein
VAIAPGIVHPCREAAELAEELGVVRVVVLEQAEGLADEVLIAGQGLGEAEFGAHQVHEVALEGRGVTLLDGRLDGILIADQRGQRAAQRVQVPVADLRLRLVAVAAVGRRSGCRCGWRRRRP